MLYRPYVPAPNQNLFFTSGQLPTIAGTADFPDTFAGQAEAALANLLALVQAENGDKSSFVKITVYLTDLGNFARWNEIYADFFAGYPMPARTCIEVSRLPKDAMIEIEAVFCI